MHRIDHPTAQSGMFSLGDAALGIAATVVTDTWTNDVQENLCQAIEAAGITLVKGNYTQLLQAIQAIAVASSKAAIQPKEVAFRNKLVNGGFRVWQRGTNLAVTTGQLKYLADRWRLDLAGASAAATYSRQSFALGQTDVPYEPEFFARVALTNGGDATNGLAVLRQCIEDVRTLAGQTAYLTFYAKADAAKTVGIEIRQRFGTGGSPSGDAALFVSNVALTTAWQKFTVPITVPSIATKSIGSDGAHTSSLDLVFGMSAGTANSSRFGTLAIQTGTFDFANIQLEADHVTSFEIRPQSLELTMCERFCEMISPGSAGAGTFLSLGVRGSTCVFSIKYKTAKRIAAALASSVALSGLSTNSVWTSGQVRIFIETSQTFITVTAGTGVWSASGGDIHHVCLSFTGTSLSGTLGHIISIDDLICGTAIWVDAEFNS